MPTIDDNDHGALSANILFPVSSDKSALQWDGNDANILGLLYETGRYYRKTGLFQTLIEHRAVALSNGRLAVEDPNTVHFITGAIDDPRSFDDPCPPSAVRIQEIRFHNDEVDLGTRSGARQSVLSAIPDEHKSTIVMAKHCVKKDDSSFLYSLSSVFGNAEPSDQLIEDADGSGLAFLDLLRARGTNAGARDKALATSVFSGITRDGVKGELTLDSFTAFLKVYKAARRNIAPASRPNDEAEVEMISVIAIKDSASRELYELKTTLSPPSNLDSAAAILSGMLRGRVRCEEIEQLGSGGKGLALVTPRGASSPAPPPPAVVQALAAMGVNVSTVKPEVLAALVSSLAPADPRKTGAGKIEIPRGPDGKPSKWIDGMAKCRCGINGGKHLFKDCPKAKEKKEKAAATGRALSTSTSSASSSTAGSASEDQIRSIVASLLATASPAELFAEGGGAAEGAM